MRTKTKKSKKRRSTGAEAAVYGWTTGSCVGLDAQRVGELFEHLEHLAGCVTPEVLLESAHPKGAYLHNYFEWDDTVAAKKYRFSQAQYLIRSHTTLPPGKHKIRVPVRTLLHIRVPGEKHVYRSTPDVLRDKDMRAYVLQCALAELKAFRAKYMRLIELIKVLRAIDRVLKDQE